MLKFIMYIYSAIVSRRKIKTTSRTRNGRLMVSFNKSLTSESIKKIEDLFSNKVVFRSRDTLRKGAFWFVSIQTTLENHNIGLMVSQMEK